MIHEKRKVILSEKELELKEKLSNLTTNQMNLINEYCDNNWQKLKNISHNAFGKFNIPLSEYNDLYDDAANVLLESVVSFDNARNIKFKTYLTSNIKKSASTWFRDNYLRAKKQNLALDSKGRILKDENANPIIVKNVSFDATDDNGDVDLTEKIASDFNVETESQFDFDKDENVETFLNSLSRLQKNILLMKMENFSIPEILSKLNISSSKYQKEMEKIQTNKNISLFTKNITEGIYKTYKNEVKNVSDRIMEIDESSSYRTDKNNLFSLLENKKNGDINCHYISQREPFQWTPEEANRYFCRVLCNLPIPEIVLCEQRKKGKLIVYLIDGLQRLSYAEAFKENRIKIGAVGAERHLIKYYDYLLDENGNRVLDEDGCAIYEEKVFDVVGKRYKDLPEYLRKRFNMFNINVTQFFDCTDEQIADHIRDYNNHSSMNKEQSGLTKISTRTVEYIKQISQNNPFFKNCGKFTKSNEIKGKFERIVAESIMLLFFQKDWKSKLDAVYKYVDNNATEQQFLKLNSHFNRLELALGDNNEELNNLFTYSTTPMWISVFDRFITYDIDDSQFINFLKAYNNELKDKEINGVSMSNFKTTNHSSKNKAVVIGKIDLVIQLMEEYFDIPHEVDQDDIQLEWKISSDNVIGTDIDMTENTEDNSKSSELESVVSFVQETLSDNEINAEDIIEYEDFLEDVLKINTLLYQQCKIALIALTGYAYKIEEDVLFSEWLTKYSQNNMSFGTNQKSNYAYLKHMFDIYCKRNRGKKDDDTT